MADFSPNATQLTAAQGAGTAPIAPVQEQVIPTDLSAVKGLVDMFSDNMKAKRKVDAEKLKQGVIGAYAKEQQAINEGVASGELNPRTAAIKSKATLGTYLANYSQYTKELHELRSAFEGGTELGDVVDASKEALKVKEARRSAAISKGAVIRPWMSPEEEESELVKTERQASIIRDFERKRDLNAESRAQGVYDRSTADWEGKKQAFQLMQDTAEVHLTSTSGFIKNLSNNVRNGKITQEEAKLEINTYFTGINQTLLAASKGYPEDAAHFKNLFSSALEIANKAIDPKTSADEVNNEYSRLIGLTKLTAIRDPKVRANVAGLELFKNNPVSGLEILNISKGTLARMAANDEDTVGATAGKIPSDRPPTIVGDPSAEKDAIGFLTKNIKLLGTPTFKDKDGAEREIANIVNKTLRQTAKEFSSSSGGSNDAKKFIALSKFYASPEFGKFASSGKLSREAQVGAENAWMTTYVPAVRDSIQEELSKPLVGTSARASVDMPKEALRIADIVNVSFSGASVKFSAKADSKLSSVELNSQRTSVEALKSSQDALTQLIKTGAHLEGHMKYDEYWEKNKYTFLPQIYPAPAGVIVNGYRSKGLANGPENWEKVK